MIGSGKVGALAEFQRTITSRRSRFDRFLDGEYKAMTDEEIHGMHLFRTKARCMNCHNGQYLTDESFHNIGLTYYKRKYEDLGRYHLTSNPADAGRFKTPSLRDVMHNAPWMRRRQDRHAPPLRRSSAPHDITAKNKRVLLY